MADNYHISLEFKAIATLAGGRSFSNLYGACHLNDGLCVCAPRKSGELDENQKKRKTQLMIMIKNVTSRVLVFLLTR